MNDLSEEARDYIHNQIALSDERVRGWVKSGMIIHFLTIGGGLGTALFIMGNINANIEASLARVEVMHATVTARGPVIEEMKLRTRALELWAGPKGFVAPDDKGEVR